MLHAKVSSVLKDSLKRGCSWPARQFFRRLESMSCHEATKLVHIFNHGKRVICVMRE